MADVNDPNAHIREYLRYYLNLPTSPGYAVMIRGSWGIGKTFLVRKILAEQFPDDKGYIYVSLYGVSTTDEIGTAIIAAMFPILKTKVAKVTGGLLNAAYKYFSVDGTLKFEDVIDRSTKSAYVFDDIERSSMSADAIFGYINQLVEHEGCRVILVANEAELEKADGYLAKREKLVGQTLEAKSAVHDALEAFIGEVADIELRDYLKSAHGQIIDLYEQGDVNNLRVLRQTLWDFGRFYSAVEPHHRKHPRAMSHILRLLFALSFEIKLGRMQAADLRGRRDHWISAAMAKEGSAIKTSFDRYNGIDLTETTLSDELLIELLVRGVVDEGLIKRDLDASSWFLEPNDEPSWRTIWHRLERDEDTVTAAISTLESEMAEFRYCKPGEILHIFGIMLMMSDAEILPVDREDIVRNAKTYITTLREQGKLPPMYSYSSFDNFPNRAWGGLGFTEADTPDMQEIFRFLMEQRTLARIERLPVIAKQLMKELDDDPDLFSRRLVGFGGEKSDLIDGPVLKEIDPKEFLGSVLRQPAPVQFQVFQCLLSRYNNGGFDRGLEEERPWVKGLHESMLSIARDSGPVQRNRLTVFAGWVGQHVKGNPA